MLTKAQVTVDVTCRLASEGNDPNAPTFAEDPNCVLVEVNVSQRDVGNLGTT